MSDLTNQYISASFDKLLQVETAGTVTDGLGVQPSNFIFTNVTASNITGNASGLTGVVSSSYATTASYALNVTSRTQTTGTSIDFVSEKVYNTATSPGTGDITVSQTNAVLGVIQKLYHNSGSAPSFSGVSDIQIMGTGTYTTSVINVIYTEWTETDRVEYWITQEG
jgi:hypothetical protein